jgi:thiol-disulfide isomerase/thioredoxin
MTRRWESDGLDPVGARDHARGPKDAPVTLVKYGDYECPYCGEAHPVLKELQDRVGEQVRFVFRHFPSTRCIPVPAVPLRLRRRPPLRVASGRCMTSSTSVKTNSAKKT